MNYVKAISGLTKKYTEFSASAPVTPHTVLANTRYARVQELIGTFRPPGRPQHPCPVCTVLRIDACHRRCRVPVTMRTARMQR